MFAQDANTGRRFGKYEVLCRLSTGGMASIFLARQHGPVGFQKIVVLKQILPNIASDTEYVRMFANEARITARFAHPNIAYVYDLDASPEHGLYLVMEFIEGASLLELLRTAMQRGVLLPPGFSLAVARDVALALHYAHTFVDATGVQRPVIHRDIAEKNIMVSFGGVTKLLDFGIAKGRGQRTVTNVGHVRGTIGYMSPEYILGQEPDGRSDVFGLGVTLYETLTSRALYPGIDAAERIKATLNLHPEPPSKHNPRTPPAADAVVLKALAVDPEQRYQSAYAFAGELDALPGLFTQAQCAEVLLMLFAERRTQTRAFLMEVGATESSGDVDLNQLSQPQVPVPSETLPTSDTPVRPSRISDSRAVTLADDEDEHPPAPTTDVGPPAPVRRDGRAGAKLAALAALGVVVLGLTLALAAKRAPPDERVTAAALLPRPTPVPHAATTSSPPEAAVEPAAKTEPGPMVEPRPRPEPAGAEMPEPAPPAVRPAHSGVTPARAKPAAPAPAPVPAAARTGFLSLVTRPYAQVALKGKALGVTPLHHVQLPVGHHTLALSSDEAGERYVAIDIRAGEETEVRVLLSELKSTP